MYMYACNGHMTFMCMHGIAFPCRQNRDIQEPEVIYEASDEESDDEPATRLHLLASDSER